MSFTITATEGKARVGEIHTKHGVVQTPAFVPCATHGSLRGVPLSIPTWKVHEPSRLESAAMFPALDLILANAYHLYLRPSIDRIEQLGGLHAFMNWNRAILTDSGGFQAFALPKFVKFSDSGIRFRSHLDGSEHLFTPERVIDIQERLGVDMATCLDVCTGFPVPESEVAQAVDQTNTWAERSVASWQDRTMLLYGMVQGSIYPKLRERSAQFLRELPFSGFAIGGNMYTFGNTIAELATEKPAMWEVVELTTSILPSEKPRHLLGVGEPGDLIAGVACGIDTFDCVMATRLARHGSVWVRRDPESWRYDRVDLTSAAIAADPAPIDEECACLACHSGYSRAYLRHLFKENDPIGGLLLSIHNVAFLTDLTEVLRSAIETGQFQHDFQEWLT